MGFLPIARANLGMLRRRNLLGLLGNTPDMYIQSCVGDMFPGVSKPCKDYTTE